MSQVTIAEYLQEIEVVDTHNKCCGTIVSDKGIAGGRDSAPFLGVVALHLAVGVAHSYRRSVKTGIFLVKDFSRTPLP